MSNQTVACARCGALNEVDFGRCIRCGLALDDAAPAQRARRRVPARRADARARLVLHGEKLWGRFGADDLPVTKALLALNLLVYAGQMATALAAGTDFGVALLRGGTGHEAYLYGALPTQPALRVAEQVILQPGLQEPWRLLSACFVHHGLIHIGMNMMGLVHLGRVAEPIVGSVRFAIIYLLSGIGGFALSLGWAYAMGPGALTAGASASLFGLLGLLLGFAYRIGHPMLKRRLLESVGFALFFGFVVPFIDNAAHIGGLVVGVAGGWLVGKDAAAPSRRWQRILAHLLALAAIGALLAARASPVASLILQDAAS